MSARQHLGRIYAAELVFEESFSQPITTSVTDDPADLAKITDAVTRAFASMSIMHAVGVRTLVDTSKGAILVTAKRGGGS